MTNNTISTQSPHYFDRAYLRREVFTQNNNGNDNKLSKTETAEWLGIDENNEQLEALFENGEYKSATLFVRAVERLINDGGSGIDISGSGIDIGDNLLSIDELETVFGLSIVPKTNNGTAKSKNKR